MRIHRFFTTTLFFLFLPALLQAQDNYEIQVYGAQTIPKGFTMLELHSNYTMNGFKDVMDGVMPTDKAFHETIEITHGFNSWFEVGVYQFLSVNNGAGISYVGNHIRPRVMVPEKNRYYLGLSLSAEFGYQDRRFAADEWTMEIRPILDKTLGKWYFAINPTVDYSFSGLSHSKGLLFSPNFKFSYECFSFLKAGLEYYNSAGPLNRLEPLNRQTHQLAFALDFNFSPKWELNVGYVRGLTVFVEQDIFKIIIGRRIGKSGG